MKLLKCLICRGEIELIFNKKVKCKCCGFSDQEKKAPEVYIKK